MAFDRDISAGTQNAWLCFLDNENFAIGNTPDAMTPGEIRPSYQFIGIQQMPSGIPEGEVVPVEGDDTVLGNFLFGSNAPRQFLINMGQDDQTLNARLQGTKVTNEGRTTMGLIDPAHPVYPTVAVLVQGRAIIRTPGQLGQSAWMGHLYPVCQIQPLGRETFQGRTAASYRYLATAQEASHRPWGVTISETADGDTGAYAYKMDSYNPLTMDAFMADGILTSWILNKTPATGVPLTDYTRPYIERVLATPSSVTPGTKTMVLPSVYVSGNRGVVLYEYT